MLPLPLPTGLVLNAIGGPVKPIPALPPPPAELIDPGIKDAEPEADAGLAAENDALGLQVSAGVLVNIASEVCWMVDVSKGDRAIRED